MDVGEMKSVVLNRPSQKRVTSELLTPTVISSNDEGKNNQRVIRKCEITLSDESCGHFPMILWNEDLIMFALRFWKPKVSCLLVSEKIYTLGENLYFIYDIS